MLHFERQMCLLAKQPQPSKPTHSTLLLLFPGLPTARHTLTRHRVLFFLVFSLSEQKTFGTQMGSLDIELLLLLLL